MSKFYVGTNDLIKRTLFVLLGCLLSAHPLLTQAQADTVKGPIPIPMTPSAMAGSSPMPMPGTAGPLQPNPRPIGYKMGILGTMYITGVVSGIAQWQNNIFPGDRQTQTDLSQGEIFVQKNDGFIQYYLQAGGYSIPAIGVPYIRSTKAVDAFYGMFPQGYIKLAPVKNFSLQAGKLPTLIGAEYTFSFENMNIQRGLLWNQENAVNRGVQANYTTGPFTVAASWNDGFYSNIYSWAWVSLFWAINTSNSLFLVGGANTRHTSISTSATPLFQNNQQIYGLSYVFNKNKWTIEPYVQYTSVPRIPEIGANQRAETYGAALYLNYHVFSNDNGSNINLPLRLEYINSTGDAANGAPNLLYGVGSNAWSITITPAWQYKRLFVRPEFSFVKANKITTGYGFGSAGNNDNQLRLLAEVGLLF